MRRGRGVSPNFQPRRVSLRLLLCHLNHGWVKESTRKRFIPSARKDSKVTVVVSILFYLMSARNISFKRRRHLTSCTWHFYLKRILTNMLPFYLILCIGLLVCRSGLERWSCKWKVGSSNPSRHRTNSLKQILAAPPLNVQQ